MLTHKNQGAAATRNKAYSLCNGDYIQFLDADDLIGPNKIARQMEALGESPNKRTLLSGSWGQFMYRYHRTKFVPSALWCDLSPAEWLIRKMQSIFTCRLPRGSSVASWQRRPAPGILDYSEMMMASISAAFCWPATGLDLFLRQSLLSHRRHEQLELHRKF